MTKVTLISNARHNGQALQKGVEYDLDDKDVAVLRGQGLVKTDENEVLPDPTIPENKEGQSATGAESVVPPLNTEEVIEEAQTHNENAEESAVVNPLVQPPVVQNDSSDVLNETPEQLAARIAADPTLNDNNQF